MPAEGSTGESGNGPPAIWNEEFADLPYSRVSRMKILGNAFHRKFTFEEHFERILDRAKTRMAIIGSWREANGA